MAEHRQTPLFRTHGPFSPRYHRSCLCLLRLHLSLSAGRQAVRANQSFDDRVHATPNRRGACRRAKSPYASDGFLTDKSRPISGRPIVTEDAAFFDHDGIDSTRSRRRSEELEEGALLRGGSTITQQLAKNLYLSPSRNPARKLPNCSLRAASRPRSASARILEIYLNIDRMGRRHFRLRGGGAEPISASPRRDSDDGEAALLVDAIIDPPERRSGTANEAIASPPTDHSPQGRRTDGVGAIDCDVRFAPTKRAGRSGRTQLFDTDHAALAGSIDN